MKQITNFLIYGFTLSIFFVGGAAVQTSQSIADDADIIISQMRPRTAQDYNKRGLAYHSKDEFDLAIQDFSRAIEMRPRHVEPYYNRGNAYHSKGQHDMAIPDYDRAIKLDSKYIEAYFNRGIAYADKGLLSHAIVDYTITLELNPKHAEAYYKRAIAYYFKKFYDKAWEDVHRAKGLGYEVHDSFIKKLRSDSGRKE